MSTLMWGQYVAHDYTEDSYFTSEPFAEQKTDPYTDPIPDQETNGPGNPGEPMPIDGGWVLLALTALLIAAYSTRPNPNPIEKKK